MKGTQGILWRILMLWWLAFGAEAETLTMGVGDWCPYVCDPRTQSGREGYLVDIAREVFEAQGIGLKTVKLPFARNVQMNRQGLLDGIIGVYRTDRRDVSRDFVFSHRPLGWGVNRWYVAASSDWHYRGIESLERLSRIATVKAYDYGSRPLEQYLETHARQAITIAGHDPQQRLIQLLRRGRIDAFVEDEHVADYELRATGATGDIQPAGALGEPMPVYIAFSPTLPDERAARYRALLRDGVDRLRQSGRLEDLLLRYQMNDWLEPSNQTAGPDNQ